MISMLSAQAKANDFIRIQYFYLLINKIIRGKISFKYILMEFLKLAL